MKKECKIRFGGATRYISGGPYFNRPTEYFGVKMAAEIDRPCDVSIPTKDFSVPPATTMRAGIRAVLKPLALGDPIYVGCMGGIGRTGLFLACLAKVLGEKDPVGYVRRYYLRSAVETQEQVRYVTDFELGTLKDLVPRYKRAAWWIDFLPKHRLVRDLTIRIFKL